MRGRSGWAPAAATKAGSSTGSRRCSGSPAPVQPHQAAVRTGVNAASTRTTSAVGCRQPKLDPATRRPGPGGAGHRGGHQRGARDQHQRARPGGDGLLQGAEREGGPGQPDRAGQAAERHQPAEEHDPAAGRPQQTRERGQHQTGGQRERRQAGATRVQQQHVQAVEVRGGQAGAGQAGLHQQHLRLGHQRGQPREQEHRRNHGDHQGPAEGDPPPVQVAGAGGGRPPARRPWPAPRSAARTRR